MPNYKAPGVYVEEVPSGSAPIAGVSTSTAAFVGLVPNTLTYPAPMGSFTVPTAVGQVKLITNFTEFKKAFGDFSEDEGQSILAHAVYGFFNNGGSRCFVTRVVPPSGANIADIQPALELFEPIEEISIVAAPGLTDATQYNALTTHCALTKSSFAILDTALQFANDDYTAATALADGSAALPADSAYAALYFPWIQVFDPATKALKFVPPSGHMAGIYARVDTQRGVHKAPANEPIFGAVGLKYAVSPSKQEGLNPHGVNCLRNLNGAIRVWGARTIGGDANTEFKYVSVRRLFIYLRGSIDQGTQWTVFEPNNADLWARITRNVDAFLKNVWAAGALFGDKPEAAYYVKCDAETNPPSVRDLGMVVTEIGVAVTKPAEFVVFRIGQRAEAAS